MTKFVTAAVLGMALVATPLVGVHSAEAGILKHHNHHVLKKAAMIGGAAALIHHHNKKKEEKKAAQASPSPSPSH